MQLWPAIDLRGGRCVRLLRGDYGAETVYGDDPVAQARRFVHDGAGRLHVVDLDGARSGDGANRDAIASVIGAVDVPVQVGGGVRSEASAAALFDMGAWRVVIGTAAVEDPDVVALAATHGRVAVGLDVRGEQVATHGWEEASGVRIGSMIDGMADRGADAFVITQISQDGTMEGPDEEGLAAALAATGVPVVASGGVGDTGHLRSLRALAVTGPDGPRRLSGVIVGRALYEGALRVPDAVAAAEDGAR